MRRVASCREGQAVLGRQGASPPGGQDLTTGPLGLSIVAWALAAGRMASGSGSAGAVSWGGWEGSCEEGAPGRPCPFVVAGAGGWHPPWVRLDSPNAPGESVAAPCGCRLGSGRSEVFRLGVSKRAWVSGHASSAWGFSASWSLWRQGAAPEGLLSSGSPLEPTLILTWPHLGPVLGRLAGSSWPWKGGPLAARTPLHSSRAERALPAALHCC